ncbi:predicted protein [Sclerotinia sclerotiorum 1980 UF-70]|uniref:Uncharacterized protein n=1 Tax=Sclerotinia sclerotiorum (strain ATCC 18683 / 1980 / Ss-1) TaxID=665079 RepID=A7F781_SCLS1|nr:predicted protein [Sclerotinia sclerotiorum 1980 UF-70]EDN98602.1 predicted protein [Sclerotinia sclerotiorum 1980 UF-70]
MIRLEQAGLFESFVVDELGKPEHVLTLLGSSDFRSFKICPQPARY